MSRRQEQPFGVIALRSHGPRPGPPPPEHELVAVERALLEQLRRTDLLVRWDDVGHWLVFCPMTVAEGTKELCQRARREVGAGRLRCGIASFPNDALVLDELIDLALRRLDPGDDGGAGSPPGRPRILRRWLRSRLSLSARHRDDGVAKRAFDLALLAASAPVWLPTVSLVALAIKLSAPRAPVLFRQQRTGRGGRRFEMWKFRTMVPDAEARKKSLAHLNQLQWPDFKIADDPRVTRIGALLRRTSLDELPQVWNILRGDMSWVGPRPTSFAADTYALWHTARLDVQPGLTGLWQVDGRARVEFDERLRFDMAYIDRRSIALDLRILLRTAREVVAPRGGM